MKSKIIILVIILCSSCSRNEETIHYFKYEDPLVKTESKSENYIEFTYSYISPDPIYPRSTVYHYRFLVHNIGLDTFFIKSKSYLDGIKIYDASFFENKQDVGNFWGRHTNSKFDSV